MIGIWISWANITYHVNGYTNAEHVKFASLDAEVAFIMSYHPEFEKPSAEQPEENNFIPSYAHSNNNPFIEN